MPENPESTLPATGDDTSKNDERETQPTSQPLVSSPRSILGLGLVSILNIGCVAFIAFHFTTHADDSAQAEQIKLRPGNISLEPAPAYLLAIPSQFERSGPKNAKRTEDEMMPSVPVQASLSEEPRSKSDKKSEMASNYWVQLGALSKIETARSHWTKLQEKHNGLLASYQPKLVGPDQVGGNLHHLRIGPLPAELATDLCENLKHAGADCFCVAAEGKESEHELVKSANHWPEPS